MLNIFGGKITTYRRLAESMLEEIEAVLGKKGNAWTAGAPLPGGDFPVNGFNELVASICSGFPFLDCNVIRRLVRLYGTEVNVLLCGAKKQSDLGRDFGNGLYEAEIRYLMEHEWARSAKDVLFRRTKLGIRMTADEIDAVDQWLLEAGLDETQDYNRPTRKQAGKS